jgi:acetyl-CoA carboxylase biotin carboxylase subunit
MPSPGTLRGLRRPSGPGIRFDDAVYTGYTVPVHYDPLMAKLIAWGVDRREAIARMARALDEMRIDGVKTSVSFHRKVMGHPAFIDGALSTGFLEEHPDLLSPDDDPWLNEIAVVAAAVAHFRRVEARSARGAVESGPGGPSAWRRALRGGWGR